MSAKISRRSKKITDVNRFSTKTTKRLITTRRGRRMEEQSRHRRRRKSCSLLSFTVDRVHFGSSRSHRQAHNLDYHHQHKSLQPPHRQHQKSCRLLEDDSTNRLKTVLDKSKSRCVLALLLTVLLSSFAATVTSNQILVINPATISTTTTASTNSSSSNFAHHIAILQQSNQQQQPQIQASFSTPNLAINITHVTYDPLHDKVYVGATNFIYQLNGSDLNVDHEQSTGPVLDNPSCGITECRGDEDHMKPTQNVNKILVVDYQHKKLLSCGSTKQGACRRYALNNIAQQDDLISMAVAANDDNSSTYAFIAPARYNYDSSYSSTTVNNNSPLAQYQQQQVLYVAATYTKVGPSRDLLVPSIGTRTLDDGPNLLKLQEGTLDSARIDINSHLRDYFLVNYLYGFASSNYIYFVTVQKKATSRDYEELGYHTRLARICITDSSYNSYTEVDLKCMPNKRKSNSQARHSSFYANQANSRQQTPDEYPLLQDAILVDAGSQLLQSLAQNDQSSPLSSDFLYNNPSSGSASPDDNKVLLGVFSSARDHTQHAGEHSALCAFSLSQIEDKFNDNIHNCYTGKMQSRNMEYIAGNVQDCPKSGQGGNVVNFCHETLKINGTLPIVSEASIQFLNTTLTAITATSHVNSNVKNIYSDQLAAELAAFNSSAKLSTSSNSGSSSSSLNPSANQNQNTVVFMGTSNGHIKKVLLNNASNGIEFEDVQLDTNPILGDLHVHSSGQHLIAATPYKVMKVPTHNCAQHSTCRECSQSRNPYCGWCLLKRSCTTRNECLSSSSSSTTILGISQPSPTSQSDLSSAAAASTNKQPLKWISNESASKCIDVQSIQPDKIPITSTGKLDLNIERLPKEQKYMCIFDRKDQTAATSTKSGLSCPLPKVTHRPKIQPGRDHAIVDLAVRSAEHNTDFLNEKITFFDCQRHTNCKDCLSTSWGCNWCLNENICLFNTSKCEKTGTARQLADSLATGGSTPMQLANGRVAGGVGIIGGAPVITNGANQRASLAMGGSALAGSFAHQQQQQLQVAANQRLASNTISQMSQCPSFELGHKQEILIADGSEKELTLKVKNMPSFKGNIQCVLEIENDKISLKARIEEDRVICENFTYSYIAEVGLLNGQLSAVYSENNILIDRTSLTMYKCHLLGAYMNRPDCPLCLRIDPRFNCAWCSGACHYRSRCNERPEDSCPVPRIDYIQQRNGPTPGGTRLSIEGSNLGQSYDEFVNRVTVDNVPQYNDNVPNENESLFRHISGYITATLVFLLYLTLASIALAFIYSTLFWGYRIRQKSSSSDSAKLDKNRVYSVSRDAYYSLNEHKLLREPHLQLETVNLYVIVDTDILEPMRSSGNNNNNLLLDSSAALPYNRGQLLYEDGSVLTTSRRSNMNNYNTASNTTITVALRALECDTISQVKVKILNELYRNSPHSVRLGSNDVELTLCQEQPPQRHNTLSGQVIQTGGHFGPAITLLDEDYSSFRSTNGLRRINTLRHYGVVDQAIMTLKRLPQSSQTSTNVSQSVTKTTLIDMLDHHYNNPYSEIQYAPIGRGGSDQSNPIVSQSAVANMSDSNKSWHLARNEDTPLF